LFLKNLRNHLFLKIYLNQIDHLYQQNQLILRYLKFPMYLKTLMHLTHPPYQRYLLNH
jgi:hypothetical protein